MIIGVPREIKEQENRVSLVPWGVSHLVKSGHCVLVERGAGAGAGYDDQSYASAGALLYKDHAAIFDEAELIVKVKEPVKEEYGLFRPNQLLFTYLHLAANKSLTIELASAGVIGIAYETIEINGRLPLLEPMSEIAGRMSVVVGAYFLTRHKGGSGVLLGGVPGVLPGRVVVLGGGSAGVNAARIASGLGAEVTILEVDLERMRFLDMTMQTTSTLYSNEDHLLQLLPSTDLLIGAVLVPGAKAPKLITRAMLKTMRPGSVFVDIAVDQGGCAETSRPTTHDNPIFTEENILHYCVANMPGAYARTATQALANATFPYVSTLANSPSLTAAVQRVPALLDGVNIYGGKITCLGVAESHGLPFHDPKEILQAA